MAQETFIYLRYEELFMSALDRFKTIMATAKGKALVVVGTAGMFIVQNVSAGNITDGISPVITDVTELLPLMLALVIASLPIIVALSVIGFLLGLFDGILGKIRL
jgi:hypothetical protein